MQRYSKNSQAPSFYSFFYRYAIFFLSERSFCKHYIANLAIKLDNRKNIVPF